MLTKQDHYIFTSDAVQPSTKKKKTEKEARRARERRFKAPSSVKSFNQLLEFEVCILQTLATQCLMI